MGSDEQKPKGSDEPEPTEEEIEAKKAEMVAKTLGKVVDIATKCPNFFNWDWCQIHCPLYKLCDGAQTVQDASLVPPANGWAEALKRWLKG